MVMGTLVINFKLGGSPQLIRYVTLQEAQAIQIVIRHNAIKEEQIVRIRHGIKTLRKKGYSDAQIRTGINSMLEGDSLEEFERRATTWPTMQIASYRLVEDDLFDTPRASFVRLHTLQPYDFASVELQKRGLVQAL
jgi:hypothetical protein